MVENYVSAPPKASAILADLLSQQRPGVDITSIDINKTGTMTLQGTVDSRDTLLKLQDDLRQSGHYTSVYSPLSNIVRGSAAFYIQAVVKPPYGL